MQRLIDLATSHSWACLPEKLEEIAALAERRLNGRAAGRWTASAAPFRVEDRRRRGRRLVAVVRLHGVLFPRGTMLTETSGAVSAEAFGQALRELVENDRFDAIVIDVDSPGGLSYSIPEVAADMFRLRGRKPIVAVANHTAGSAAYWLASQADELVVTPSGEVGSIGVWSLHVDQSEADKLNGLKYTHVHAGRYKVERNPHQPLSDEARAHMQTFVDEDYRMFVQAVARGRGVSLQTVRQNYGEGRMFRARDALAMGLADRIESLEETLARLSR